MKDTSVQNSKVEIQKATIKDVDRIRSLAIPIFTESYQSILSPEQNEYMLDWMYSTDQITKEIEGDAQYYILVVDGKDQGYTSIEMVDKERKLFKLHKIYLSHAVHKRGYGKFQLREMEKIAASQGGKLIKLNVNRNNAAVEFYKSQGWEISHVEDNHIGNGYYMNDFVLQKDLS